MAGKRISNVLKNRWLIKKHHILIAQLGISLYGGYFGGGLGILLLAVFSFIGIDDIHTMNGLKTLFSAIINFMASIIFILTGHVSWTLALPMIVCAILGGLVGPWWARRMPQSTLRMIILIFSSATTAWFFWKTYH